MKHQGPLLSAKVTFVGPDQGGRTTQGRSGFRSTLKVNDLFTSCIVWGRSEEEIFDFGVECHVRLELFFWEQVKNGVYVGMPVQLNEGSRVVGYGSIESMAAV